MRKRDHGGVVFIDLRDHYGITQVVGDGAVGEEMQRLKPESVICISGNVRLRGEGLENKKLPTGEIEVQVSSCRILSACETLPFQVAEDDGAPEPTRLKYRFLELRRDKLHHNIVLRNRVIAAAREIMHDLGFLEFQTPILTSSSPEGARDFIVPSRLHPGMFYALPQAPQQFKQLIMMAGFDRYFQIAPCFRDEDARADRSPGEFYQIDMELSFVELNDVLHVNELLMTRLFSRFALSAVTEAPFPRFAYDEVMRRYGTDKPDLRVSLVIENISEIFAQSGFRVFQEAAAQGHAVRAIRVPVSTVPSRKYFDDAVASFQKQYGTGVAYLVLEPGAHKGNIAKFVSPEEVQALRDLPSSTEIQVVFIAAGSDDVVLPALGKLRTKLGADFGCLERGAFRFCWVTDFPFYERDPQSGEIVFGHNPFSMPQGGMEALTKMSPIDIKASQYDLVCNGYELASGAIRNYSPDIMYKAFEIAGYSRETVDEKFGGMIRAFRFGAPPHGGIAHGVERIVMLLAGEDAIREVIAFPLAQNGEDLLMGAPSAVSDKQLREVHIALALPAEKGRSPESHDK